METTSAFLQGIFKFEGQGLDKPRLLDPSLTYSVPGDKRAQLIYLRAGNSGSDLLCLVLMRDGKPMRYFPVGAKADTHVPLAVVEDLMPDTRLEIHAAANSGALAHVVVDVGLLEV